MKWIKNNYKHYLITRFNVRINSMKTKQLDKKDICVDPDYLKNRFAIFEKYTVPSVINQTCKNFEWIVLFCYDTPIEFKNKISDMQEKKYFTPIYIKDDDNQASIISNYIKKDNANGYVISRIDNDDALNVEYIEEVQNYISNTDFDNFVISFPNGIQYELEKKIASKYYFPSNHFLTLCQLSREGDLLNIFDYNHMDISNNFTIKYACENKLLWMEIVHASNITNRMHIKIKDIIKRETILQDYGIKDELLNKKTIINAYFYSIFNYPINAFRLLKMYGLKKVFIKLKEKIKGAH